MEQDCTIIALTEPKLIEGDFSTSIMGMGVYEFVGRIYFPKQMPRCDCRFEAIKDVVPQIDKIHENTTFEAKVKFENGKYSLLEIDSIENNP